MEMPVRKLSIVEVTALKAAVESRDAVLKQLSVVEQVLTEIQRELGMIDNAKYFVKEDSTLILVIDDPSEVVEKVDNQVEQ